MNATVRDITVNDLKSNTFYAVINLKSEGGGPDDSRPSDAIARALRTSSPSSWMKSLDSAGHFDPKATKRRVRQHRRSLRQSSKPEKTR
jgi:bifunctional DNase/RNase